MQLSIGSHKIQIAYKLHGHPDLVFRQSLRSFPALILRCNQGKFNFVSFIDREKTDKIRSTFCFPDRNQLRSLVRSGIGDLHCLLFLERFFKYFF